MMQKVSRVEGVIRLREPQVTGSLNRRQSESVAP
jgi:hypothetical protein